MFNALKYTEELEKAGFTREQAEVSMKLLVETMNENFATKSDFKELGWKIEKLETKLDSSLKELEYKLTIKLATILGTMMTFAIGLTAAVVKLLPATGH